MVVSRSFVREPMANTARVLRDLNEAATELERRALDLGRTTPEREADLEKARRIRHIIEELEALDLDG
jgi:hypothetical protein